MLTILKNTLALTAFVSICFLTVPSQGVYQEGEASWYGKPFHGRLTASGEKYDMHDLTAAHRTLSFGSKVKVVSEETGRSVVVTINDRGPFVDDRVIDLSKGAARQLGFVDKGVEEVSIHKVKDKR